MLKNPLALSAILFVVYLAATGNLVKFAGFALGSNAGSTSAFKPSSSGTAPGASGALQSLGLTGSGSGGNSGVVGGLIGAGGATLL